MSSNIKNYKKLNILSRGNQSLDLKKDTYDLKVGQVPKLYNFFLFVATL